MLGHATSSAAPAVHNQNKQRFLNETFKRGASSRVEAATDQKRGYEDVRMECKSNREYLTKLTKFSGG